MLLTSSIAFARCVAFLSVILPQAQSCAFHGDVSRIAKIDYRSIEAANVAARSARSLHKRDNSSTPIVLQNVRVFNGTVLLPPSTVVINGNLIGNPTGSYPAATTFDAQNMTLLPGLIDSHSHPLTADSLTNMTRYGITTTFSAFCPAPQFCASLNNHTGLTSLVSASFFATAPGSEHAKLLPASDASFLINSTAEVPAFVAQQVSQGSRFIKVIGSAPLPGLSQEEQTALVSASHAKQAQVVLHTSSYSAYEQGLIAGVDQIHHSTLDKPIDDTLINMFAARNTIVCPTLTMMRAITQQDPSANGSYSAAAETVTLLHKAGIPIIAGTDSNMTPGLPAMVSFGSSLHDELENLLNAGLTAVEALNAATALPAKYFGLADRGVIKEGMRADLVLIDGDPIEDLTNTRKIVKVWVNGVEFVDSNSTLTTTPSGTAASKSSTTSSSPTASASGGSSSAAASLDASYLLIGKVWMLIVGYLVV